jgi:hypothetical protein
MDEEWWIRFFQGCSEEVVAPRSFCDFVSHYAIVNSFIFYTVLSHFYFRNELSHYSLLQCLIIFRLL